MKLEMPKAVVFLSLLIILGSCINGFALESVEWNFQKTLKLEQVRIDVALASDGTRMFVLTQQGEIIIYSAGGEEQARLKVGNHVDSIKLRPRGDTLILRSREKDTFRLFKSYNKLNDQVIEGIAVGLGLDQREFENAMKDPALRKIIQQDVIDGRNAGVRGTPTIFINGRRLQNRSVARFQSIIDKLLQK